MKPLVAGLVQQGNQVIARDTAAGLRCFQQAHDADPSDPVARRCLTLGHIAMAAAHSDRGEREAMLAHYRRAVDVDPNHAGAHWNLAWELLKEGRLLEGWQHYEWRWRWEGFPERERPFATPRWEGENLDGARILLHGEQGFGDCIQFARYAPMVAALGGRVILEVPRPLVRVMSTLRGVEIVVARGERLPEFGCTCPLMSLPRVFGTAVESIPASVPYLGVPDGVASDRMVCPPGVRRIGLVWGGSPGHQRDERRSIGLDLFCPLTRLDGFRWYSLQKGPAAAALRTGPPDLKVLDLASSIGDFADTAAIISQLDLVVTVDTSVAHLAGALGKPVWILVPAKSDWRWLLDRTDSPWYPTARLFRQRREGDWAREIDQVHQALLSLGP
jgi:hypothetical protein